MRHAGIASLRDDRLVVLDHAQARDLGRDERLDVADQQPAAVFTLAQQRAHAVDDLLGSLADRTHRIDLAFVLPLSCELNQVIAVRADAPSAIAELVRDAGVRCAGTLPKNATESRAPSPRNTMSKNSPYAATVFVAVLKIRSKSKS